MSKRSKKAKLPKLPKYQLIDRTSKEGGPIYALLDECVRKWHSHLVNATIAVAWMIGKKADVDGRLTLGRMKKASELDREFAKHDFVMLLNREQWHRLDEKFRTALVDHELCHADQKNDPNSGDQLEDAHGKKVWRIRKHDIEEFGAVVERHGFYKSDIERFAESLETGAQRTLFSKPKKVAA